MHSYCLILCSLITVLVSFVKTTASKFECSEQLSACSCRLTSGQVLDLSPLTSGKNAPVFRAPGPVSKYYYQWDPCRPFPCSSSAKASVCQTVNGLSSAYVAGLLSTAKFRTDPARGLYLHYETTGNGNDRSSRVFLICDLKTTNPRFVSDGEVPAKSMKYEMNLTSVHACPKEKSNNVWSLGDILLLTLFLGLAIYFIGGIIFNLFVLKQSGVTRVIPNFTFWVALPGLIKAGMLFSINLIKGRRTSHAYQAL